MANFDMSGFDVQTYWEKNSAWIKGAGSIFLGAVATKNWEVAIVTSVSTLFKIGCDVAHYAFTANPK